MALKRGIVELEAYNSNWEQEYRLEEVLLKKVLSRRILEIHHVGSTSIPRLKAKPIIDILMVISSFDEINEIAKLLEPYGYENRGTQGIDDRYFFAYSPLAKKITFLVGDNTFYVEILEKIIRATA